MQGPEWVRWVVIAGLLVVMALRLGRLRRAQPLRLTTLWLAPAVLAVAFVAGLVEAPPHRALTWLATAGALLAGGAAGWWRARHIHITIDPATGKLNQQLRPAALLAVVLLIVVRRGLRYEAESWGLDLAAVTTVLIAFAVGLVAATRAEMFLRARALLAAQLAGRSIGPISSR